MYLEPARIIELIANAPARMNAFNGTISRLRATTKDAPGALVPGRFALSFQECTTIRDLEQDVRALAVEPPAPASPRPFDLSQLGAMLTQGSDYTLDH
jgi:hypothetical protein